MATLAEARQAYRRTFGLDPAESFTADQLMRAIDQSTDLEFVRQLYEKEFNIDLSGSEWSGDTRDAGFLLRAIRNNNELQDARADYAEAGKLGNYDWTNDTRTAEQLRRGIQQLTGGVSDLSSAPKGENQQQRGVGIADKDPTTPDLTILQGKEMKWYFDKATSTWLVEYGLPNSNRSIVFEATPDQVNSLFAGSRPKYETIAQKTLLARANTTFGGNIAEVEGKGTFEAEVERVITLALDEGKLPDWAAKDGVALDIIFTAQSEGKSNEWVVDQLSKTTGFKNRFPKIQKFQQENNLTLTEAISGFLEFEAGVKQAMQAYGQPLSAVDPQLVGSLLDQGHSLKVVQDTVQGFRRMKEYQPAIEAFNQVLAQKGMDPISGIQDMLDFVQGRSSAAVYEAYEASSIQEAAQAAGLGDVFSVADAIRVGKGQDHTLETATSAAQKAAELLLRMRHEVDVNKFGLDHEELLDISFGSTPRSGRSEAEIMENINRAVLSAQGALQKKANPFKSFSNTGTPEAASLRNLRQES